MPPHLHPRSAATSTLFAGTLVASFVVVAVPHIWPCPRPRKAYMDGDSDLVVGEDGRVMRRVRRVRKPAEEKEGVTADKIIDLSAASSARRMETNNTSSRDSANKRKTLQEEAEIMRQLQAEAEIAAEENARRECPVPKPGGALGRLLGFNDGSKKQDNDAS